MKLARRSISRMLAGSRLHSTHAYSLRHQLIVSLLGASALLWLISLGIVVGIAWHETSKVFDDAMQEAAYLMLASGADLHQQGMPSDASSSGTDEHRVRLYYQIVAGGRVLRRAARAPEQPFVSRGTKNADFHNVWADGTLWRVFVLHGSDDAFDVQIGQPYKARLELLEEMAGHLVWPALVLLALLGVVGWMAIHRLVRPIVQTAHTIGQKSPDDLTAISVADQPLELAPIIHALNTVLARLESALQAERRFTADAAHELRTPLAALRMKIQLLQRQHPDQHALFLALRDEVDRCTLLVENLLALARLDPGQPGALARETVALDMLFAELERSYAQMARSKQIELQIDSRVATLYGNAELLRIALRNLLDNAVRYCPAHSRVQIETLATVAGVCVSVRDNGPGVSPAERGRLTERFFRVLGTGESGSGLGLSIVARIASLHGASLHFDHGLDNRGLGVILDFPPPRGPTHEQA